MASHVYELRLSERINGALAYRSAYVACRKPQSDGNVLALYRRSNPNDKAQFESCYYHGQCPVVVEK